MVTRTQLVPSVNIHGIVTACSYCCTFVQLAALEVAYPEAVSHGICGGCSARVLGEWAA